MSPFLKSGWRDSTISARPKERMTSPIGREACIGECRPSRCAWWDRWRDILLGEGLAVGDGGDGGFGELEDVGSDEAGGAGGEFPLTVDDWHGERLGEGGRDVKAGGFENRKWKFGKRRRDNAEARRGEERIRQKEAMLEGPHRNAGPWLACKTQALPTASGGFRGFLGGASGRRRIWWLF